MPSLPRGHLLICLPPSLVFRNSLQDKAFCRNEGLSFEIIPVRIIAHRIGRPIFAFLSAYHDRLCFPGAQTGNSRPTISPKHSGRLPLRAGKCLTSRFRTLPVPVCATTKNSS